jgi:DNA-binding MarR family transcriptional regulator
LRELYPQPVMSVIDIATKLGITHQSASSLIRSFEEMGIFREITGRKKDRLFVFSEYLGLFTNRISQSQITRLKRKAG